VIFINKIRSELVMGSKGNEVECDMPSSFTKIFSLKDCMEGVSKSRTSFASTKVAFLVTFQPPPGIDDVDLSHAASPDTMSNPPWTIENTPWQFPPSASSQLSKVYVRDCITSPSAAVRFATKVEVGEFSGRKIVVALPPSAQYTGELGRTTERRRVVGGLKDDCSLPSPTRTLTAKYLTGKVSSLKGLFTVKMYGKAGMLTFNAGTSMKLEVKGGASERENKSLALRFPTPSTKPTSPVT